MTWELKVGRYSGGIISVWSTTRTLSLEASSQVGTCRSVTIWMRFTQGAYDSMLLSEYLSSPLQANRAGVEAAAEAPVRARTARFFTSHAGSSPLTQV